MSSRLPDPPTKIKLHSAHLTHQPDLPAKKVKSKSRRPRDPPDADTNPPPSTMATPSDEVEPLYMETSRDLEDTLRDMQPCFEGKEAEHNWSLREKSIVKLRRITKGNSPQELTAAYLAGIKVLLDGILKTVNSLRTTVSTNGCHLVQDIARAAGPGLDNMVEILLQNLVKLCANTKKITAANGDATVTAVVANVTYNVRIAQHIWGACQDKNVQPRSYATGWLRTIITKHRHHKNVLEHGGSLDLIEKCLKAGLADRDPKVRESMRPTYWAFARLWAERSEIILSALDPKQQKLLIDDPSNPKPQKGVGPSATTVGANSQPFSRSTNSIPARPSIKETIAAQKRAKMASKNLPERPGSAEPSATPSKSSTASIARPATAMSTIGTLSSAPVRPTRPPRRPEMRRPVTADPQPSKIPARLSPPKTSENLHNSPLSPKKSSPNLTVQGHDTPPVRKDGRILDSGIVRVRAGKLQGLNRSQDDIWEDGMKSDDLLQPLPENRHNSPLSVKKSSPNLTVQGHDTPPVRKDVRILDSGIAQVRPGKLQGLNRSREDIWDDGEKFDGLLQPLPENLHNSPLSAKMSSLVLTVKENDTPPARNDGRLLDSGIARVRAGTLEVHGFRKLQGLIRSREDIWEDGVKFDELLQLLLENLESPIIENGDGKPARVQDQIKSQVLMTIRLLQQNQPKYFSKYHSQALCAIILARKHHHSTSHIVCGLEETSESIVAQCDAEPCIDAVLDLLENKTAAPSDGTLFTGLYVLAGLLRRVCSTSSIKPLVSPLISPLSSSSSTSSLSNPSSSPLKPQSAPSAALLPSKQQARLGHLAARCIGDTNPDIRRAVIDFALELHDVVGGGEGAGNFWRLLKGASEDQRSLITYYLVRRERGNGVSVGMGRR